MTAPRRAKRKGSVAAADRVLTPEVFARLLEWLGGAPASGGERYLEMHRRLVGYFQRKRCAAADDLADETLNRVARRLSEEGTIEGAAPAQYCYIVARFVFLEHWRSAEQQREATSNGDVARHGDRVTEEDDREEQRFRCLDRCLARLSRDERTLIREYYQGDGSSRITRRRELAARLAVSANALMIKASRIRQTLERCVTDCCSSDDRFGSFLSQQDE